MSLFVILVTMATDITVFSREAFGYSCINIDVKQAILKEKGLLASD